MHYDRTGKHVTDADYLQLLREPGYHRVAETALANGLRVSTIWLGLNHRYGPGTPLIFETMVFCGDEGGEIDADRYETEQQAIDGHARFVEKHRDTAKGGA